jgi:hypothetical protein
MFRYMLAVYLQDRLPGFEIVGFKMPEWDLVASIDWPAWSAPFRLPPGHKIDIEGALRAVAEGGGSDGIDIHAFAQRLEYFGHNLDRFRRLFHSDIAGEPVSDDEIVVNIRTGDILTGAHPHYLPLPLDFYRRLLMSTGLRPVFVGQINEPNWYNDALREVFPYGRFLTGQGGIRDFQTVRHARHKVIAISSFSWLAAWLSGEDSIIYYPMAGLLNPRQRGDVDLCSVEDRRFRFFQFPVHRYSGSEADRDTLLTGEWDIQGPGRYLEVADRA